MKFTHIQNKRLAISTFLLILLAQASIAQTTFPVLLAKAEKQFVKGKYSKAISKANKTVKTIRKKHDSNQAYLAWLEIHKAKSYEALGKFPEMEKSLKQGFEMLEEVSTSDFEAYVEGLNQLADVHLEAGSYAKADALLDVLKETIEKTENPSSYLLAEYQHRRTQANTYLGKLNEALATLPELKKTYEALVLEKSNSEGAKLNKYSTAYRKVQLAKLITLEGNIYRLKGEYLKADEHFTQNTKRVANLVKSHPVLTLHLKSIGDNFTDMNELKRAERAYEKALSTAQKKSQYYFFVAAPLVRIYILQEREKPTIKTLQYWEKIKSSYFRGKNIYGLQVDMLGVKQDLMLDERKRAIEELNRVLSAESDILPKYHPMRAEALNTLFKLNTYLDSDLKAAYDNLEDEGKIAEEVYGQNSIYYKVHLIRKSAFQLANTDDYKQALEAMKQNPQKAIFEQRVDTHKDRVEVNNNIAVYYDAIDKYRDALASIEKGTELLKQTFGEKDILYGNQLLRQADMEIKVGKYKEAEAHLETALKVIKKEMSRGSVEYANALSISAKLYGIIGIYSEAEQLLRRVNRIYRRINANDISQKAKTIEEMAFLYIRIGDYTETEYLLEEDIEEKEKKYGKTSRQLVKPLNQLGLLKLIVGDYKKAESLLSRASDIAKNVFGEKAVRITENFAYLSKYNVAIGDYEKAETYLRKIVDIQKKQLGENHVELGKTYIDLALARFYQSKDNIKEVENLLNKAKAIMLKNFDNRHPLYAEVLKNVGEVYIQTGKYEEASKLLFKANIIWTEKLGERNINTAYTSLLIGDIYAKLKRFTQAKEYYDKAERTYKKIFDKEHPDYIKTLSKLGQMYFVSGEYKEANRMLEKTTGSYLKYIKKYFPALSEREKARFWNKIKSDFEFYNSLAIKQVNERPELLENMYDFRLATKALLLSSSIKVRQRILNSSDEELKAKYKAWATKKEELTRLLDSPSEEGDETISPIQIQQDINRLEKELSERSELFAKNNKKDRIDWKDVRKTLKDNEAAVEIIRYRVFDNGFTDKVNYAALIVVPDAKKPELVLLEKGKALETKFLKYYRNTIRYKKDDKYSYKKFWKPIEAKLGDAKVIYLSPDGVYNQINVESLQIDNNTFVIDKANVRTVSNTKDLVLAERENRTYTSDEIVLFGNPAFYTNNDNAYLVGEERKVEKTQVITPLPGTQREVERIRSIFNGDAMQVRAFTAETASEATLKDLKSPRVLHTATHGFFNENVKSQDIDLELRQLTDNPLNYSGLMFKNAGDLLALTPNNYNSQDGILTANEALGLNLDNTELVVMSSCETGLGKVEIGEGVYGLQRSFLVAGAEALVMSLFKVSDEVTVKLMDKFYSKWKATGNKRQAFNEAQKEIKAEYKYPAYWGAFNMIGVK